MMENQNNQTEQTFKTKELVSLFLKEEKIMKKIYEKGFQDYVDNLDNLEKAFSKNNYSMCCIDEGTPTGFHSAGSGILRPKEEVLKSFGEIGVTEITSHTGCGAATLYAKENDLDPSKSDEYARNWAKNIAGELGVNYRHINSAEMNRPINNHIARVVYYDTTGQFDYSKIKKLPHGFIISRNIQSLEDSLSEVKISFNIATGNHGFGPLINKVYPFIVVVVGSNSEEVLKTKLELKDFERNFKNRAIIDSFVFKK